MKKSTIGMTVLAALVICYMAIANGSGNPTGWILNGDFSDSAKILWDTGGEGYMHWRAQAYETTHKPADKKWDMARTEVKYSNKKNIKNGAPERFLELKTVGTGHDGIGVSVRYIPFVGVYGDGDNPDKPASWKNVDGLQLDLSTLDYDKYYYLECDVYIVHHNLKDSGWYAGNEWPVRITLGLADANNSGKRFVWGFLDREDTQGLNPYTLVPKKTWYHFRSPELRDLMETRPGKSPAAYPLKRIHNVVIGGFGWELKSRVANICIVEYSTSQTSSPNSQY